MPKIRCECKLVLSYREDQAGKRVKCPVCSAKIVLPGIAPVSARPPGAAEPVARAGQGLPIQAAGAGPMVTPRKEPPLAAQPGRTPPAHVMPKDALKVEPSDEDIPLGGDLPTWGSGPKPDAPKAG